MAHSLHAWLVPLNDSFEYKRLSHGRHVSISCLRRDYVSSNNVPTNRTAPILPPHELHRYRFTLSIYTEAMIRHMLILYAKLFFDLFVIHRDIQFALV